MRPWSWLVLLGAAAWGLAGCQEGQDVVAGDLGVDRALGCGLHAEPLSLSAAVNCSSLGGAPGSVNPCDPGCRVFEEVPTDPLTADNGFSWSTGRPSSLSSETRSLQGGGCETGSDCQFNSKCVGPDAGTCGHSVCTEGDGLRADCNSCSSLVCASDPSCCDTEPVVTNCTHDPCVRGAVLDASCDTCVAAICASPGGAHCCEPGAEWDATCVDAVASVCGNTCGCGVDEVESGGRCYKRSGAERSWGEALVDCRTRGDDWDLATVSDVTENAVVHDLSAGEDLWLGLLDTGSGSAGPAGVPFIRASSEKPGNGPGFAIDGSSSTSWTVESLEVTSPLISASESQAGHPAVDAFDSDDNSYWAAESSSNTDAKILRIDLDAPVLLGDMTIRFKNAHLRTFDFEVLAGPDDSSLVSVWGRASSSLLSAEGSEHFNVTDTTAQVVEIHCYGNSSSGWNSIEEVVLGTTPATVVTREREAQWIEMVLPTSATVESIDLEWENEDMDFELWLGEDSASLSQVWSGSNASSMGLENYDIVDTPARVVRVRTLGNASSGWSNLSRFYVRTGTATAGQWAWASGEHNVIWSESSGDSGFTNWEASWSSSPDASLDCGLLRSADGLWEGNACADEKRYACEGPPRFMGSTPGDWTSSCADLAEDLCHVQCDVPTDAAPGSCLGWAPGELDSACSGPDLAVGVPCADNLPICNHGSATAPAGIEVVHYPSSAGFFAQAPAALSHADEVSCTTTEAIPPGECIALTGCVAPASGLRDVVVNPSGSVSECSTMDNWAVYDETVACGAPYCGGASVSVSKPQVDIIFIVDNSSSMEQEIDEIEARLSTDFSTIIAESGLDYRVIMISRFARDGEVVSGSYFPICIGPPLGNDACTDDTVPFALTPPFYPYSNDSESEDAWCDVLKSFSQSDEFAPADEQRPWRPLSPQGWSQWLRPEAHKSFVVITDDEVKCSTETHTFRDLNSPSVSTSLAAAFDAELLALSEEQFGTASDRKYVWHSLVGMDAPASGLAPSDPIETSRCGSDADAPGTGHQALSRLTGGLRYPVCNTSNFDAVFNRLAEEVVETSTTSCEYDIPGGSSLDPASSEVRVSVVDSATGTETKSALSLASDVSACASDRFYFDDASNPTQLIFCPTACDTLQPSLGKEVQVFVEFGCLPPTATSFTEVYEANCSTGEHPFWTFVTHEADLDDDATIDLSIRSGMDASELAGGSFHLARTIDATEPSCGLACALSLDTALDADAWSDNFIEVEWTLNPSTAGMSPVLHDWGVWYSCQDRD